MSPDARIPGLALTTVVAADFELLADLRVAAMRESLERVGRFDPQRARERLRASFAPEHTRFVVCDGERVGFYALRPAADGLHLDHLYVHPRCQNRGLGAAVLREIFREADARGLVVFVGALKESAANRFYQRHGFVRSGEGEWDIFYARAPVAGGSA